MAETRDAVKEDYEDFWKHEGPHSYAQEALMKIAAKKDDAVAHPSHYTAGKVECIDGIESALTGLEGMEAFCTGCAIKYLWRWKRKGGKQDLAKAKWYIDRMLADEKAADPR